MKDRLTLRRKRQKEKRTPDQENPTWGKERIADELWLKLGLQVSPRTIRTYWPDVPATPRRGGSQAWSTFVRNHAQALLACDDLACTKTDMTPMEWKPVRLKQNIYLLLIS